MSGYSGLPFGGLPLPGTLRMASRAAVSYKASVETGLMPSWKILCFAVFGEIPSFSAISLTVKNSFPFTIITHIIGFFIDKYSNYTQKVQLLNRRVAENGKKNQKIYTRGRFVLTQLYPLGIIKV